MIAIFRIILTLKIVILLSFENFLILFANLVMKQISYRLALLYFFEYLGIQVAWFELPLILLLQLFRLNIIFLNFLQTGQVFFCGLKLDFFTQFIKILLHYLFVQFVVFLGRELWALLSKPLFQNLYGFKLNIIIQQFLSTKIHTF